MELLLQSPVQPAELEEVATAIRNLLEADSVLIGRLADQYPRRADLGGGFYTLHVQIATSKAAVLTVLMIAADAAKNESVKADTLVLYRIVKDNVKDKPGEPSKRAKALKLMDEFAMKLLRERFPTEFQGIPQHNSNLSIGGDFLFNLVV
jgi:hypothetical protein